MGLGREHRRSHWAERGVISDKYAAGLFDGEGCVYVYRKPRSGKPGRDVQVRATVANTIPLVLEAFRERFGGSIHLQVAANGARRASYQYEIAAMKALGMFRAICPYLIVKRAQVEKAIEIQERIIAHKAVFVTGMRGSYVPPEEWLVRERLVDEFKQLHQRGIQDAGTPEPEQSDLRVLPLSGPRPCSASGDAGGSCCCGWCRAGTGSITRGAEWTGAGDAGGLR